jgi:hypothetical protein
MSGDIQQPTATKRGACGDRLVEFTGQVSAIICQPATFTG